MTNEFTEAGNLANAIRRSEQRRDKQHASADADHELRCRLILGKASPAARRLLELGLDVKIPAPASCTCNMTVQAADGSTHHEAGCPVSTPDHEPDAYAIAPSLLKEPEPMTGVVEKRRA